MSEKGISLAAGVVGIRGRTKGLGVMAVEAEVEAWMGIRVVRGSPYLPPRQLSGTKKKHRQHEE
jgi:hypothetical protein